MTNCIYQFQNDNSKIISKNKISKKFIAMLMILVVISSLILSVPEEDHQCTDDHCPICAHLEMIRHTFEGNSPSDNLGLSFLMSLIFAWTIFPYKHISLISDTLVSLKVKLSN